jgi:hypothetical protein
VLNLGAGVVTFAAGAGVTVTNTAQTLQTYQSANLVRTGLNAWTVTPDSGTTSGMTFISATTIGTTVTSVTVTGAFSATYDNYKIIVSGGVASSYQYMTLKLGATATGYYYAHNGRSYANTDQSTGASNQTSWARISAGTTDLLSANFELQNPFLTKNTFINYFFNDARTTGEAGAGGGVLANTTSYTDFTITPASGTYTGGTIRVYGYNN